MNFLYFTESFSWVQSSQHVMCSLWWQGEVSGSWPQWSWEGDESPREEMLHFKLVLWGWGKRKIKRRHEKKHSHEWTHLLKIQEEVAAKICNCRYDGGRLIRGNRKVSRKIGHVFQVFSVKWWFQSSQLAGAVHFLRACSLGNERWRWGISQVAERSIKKKVLFW